MRIKKFTIKPLDHQHESDLAAFNKKIEKAVHVETYSFNEGTMAGGQKTVVVFAFFEDEESVEILELDRERLAEKRKETIEEFEKYWNELGSKLTNPQAGLAVGSKMRDLQELQEEIQRMGKPAKPQGCKECADREKRNEVMKEENKIYWEVREAQEKIKNRAIRYPGEMGVKIDCKECADREEQRKREASPYLPCDKNQCCLSCGKKIDVSSTKPPVGLRPRSISNWQRRREIIEAMERYEQAGKEIPKEWSDELGELLEIDVSKQSEGLNDCRSCFTRDQYYKLVHSVGNIYPGETLHETALRYIKQCDAGSGDEAKVYKGN